MEPAAARASITFLQDAGLNIKVFVTDRSIPLATFDKDRSQITAGSFNKLTFHEEEKMHRLMFFFKGPSLLEQSWQRSFHIFCTRFSSPESLLWSHPWIYLNTYNFVKLDPWHFTHNIEKALWNIVWLIFGYSNMFEHFLLQIFVRFIFVLFFWYKYILIFVCMVLIIWMCLCQKLIWTDTVAGMSEWIPKCGECMEQLKVAIWHKSE